MVHSPLRVDIPRRPAVRVQRSSALSFRGNVQSSSHVDRISPTSVHRVALAIVIILTAFTDLAERARRIMALREYTRGSRIAWKNSPTRRFRQGRERENENIAFRGRLCFSFCQQNEAFASREFQLSTGTTNKRNEFRGDFGRGNVPTRCL